MEAWQAGWLQEIDDEIDGEVDGEIDEVLSIAAVDDCNNRMGL